MTRTSTLLPCTGPAGVCAGATGCGIVVGWGSGACGAGTVTVAGTLVVVPPGLVTTMRTVWAPGGSCERSKLTGTGVVPLPMSRESIAFQVPSGCSSSAVTVVGTPLGLTLPLRVWSPTTTEPGSSRGGTAILTR